MILMRMMQIREPKIIKMIKMSYGRLEIGSPKHKMLKLNTKICLCFTTHIYNQTISNNLRLSKNVLTMESNKCHLNKLILKLMFLVSVYREDGKSTTFITLKDKQLI